VTESPLPGPVSIESIDRLLHEPARLQIAALLYVVEKAEFMFVMNQTGLTWGNLSSHLAKLEQNEYVEIEKSFKGKRPLTSVFLTTKGRAAFKAYTEKMRQLFKDLPA
jgi:DNA-binding MarR family transcriptional regulator